MGFYDCMADVGKVIGRALTKDEFGALYDRLLAEKDALFKDGYPDDWLAAGRAQAEKLALQKKIALRNVVLNKAKFDGNIGFLTTARTKVNAFLAAKAMMVGINKPIEGGRDAVALRQKSTAKLMQGALLADLYRQSGNTKRLEKLFYAPAFELEIAKALHGEPAHEDAVKIAQAINRVNDDALRQENEAGGWTGRLDNFITNQSHSSLGVRKNGLQAWKDYILPKLDPRTFDREEDVKHAMRQERGEILQIQLAAREQLMQLAANLRATAKLEKRAERRVTRHEEILDGQREDLAHLVGQFLPIADKPIEARAMLKRELEDLRGRIKEQQTKARDAAASIPGLIDRWNETVALADLASEQIELFDTLQRKMLALEDKLRGAIDPDAYLDRVGKRIMADTWMAAAGEPKEFSGLMHYIGPQSLAARRATHRELHFKSAADFVEYMHSPYGNGGLADSIMKAIESRAATIELYRRFGTNPKAMWTRIVTALLREAEATGNNELTRQIKDQRLDWYMAEITGETRKVLSPTLASRSAAIRAWHNVTRLGGALISSFSDFPTAAAALQYNGRNGLTAYGDMLTGLMRGRRSGERRSMLLAMGVGFESLMGHIMSRFGGGEATPPGFLAKTASLFFRLGGLNWWTDVNKSSLGEMFAYMFAQERGNSFDKMDRHLRERLAQYGIDAADWDIIRRAAVHAAEDGNEFLTPENIGKIPLGWLMNEVDRFNAEADMGANERAARTWRDNLVSKYGSLIQDEIDHGVITPGAETTAITRMGLPRGGWPGEIAAFLMQFKSFSIAMMERGLGRAIYGYEKTTPLSATARLGWLSFQLAILGYLAMSIKDMLKGKNPRDPTDPATWVAAYLQGGGLGIMGDFAFGEFSGYGRSALGTFAGPTAGLLDDFSHLYSLARDETLQGNWGRDLASSGLRFAISNTPYASLWWLRPAINYMAIYPIQESIAPGYLRRMERKLEHDQHQTFWLPPSEVSR